MFRHSSLFSLTDPEMWDTKSCFTAQTSAWCGRATISGTGFLSKVGTTTSGSTSGFRQNDPSLRKWQSLYHLGPEGPTLSFPPSPGAELRAARGPGRFRQAEVGQWLQDAQERFDTQLDQLMARNPQLSDKITTGQWLDMKHNQLSDVMSSLEQEKGAPELSPFAKRQQLRELHEKVLQLEKDLLQMRSDLDGESNDQPNERTPGSLGRTLPMSQDNFNRQEGQKNIDTVMCQLREALRDAETRAKKQEEERNQALQKLKTSTETQRALLNQIEEMKQRFNHARKNQSELQEQLSEANNKISQACLEKAILSTRVLKLEDDIKGLKAKLTGPDKDHPIQENTDITAARVISSKQITDLEAQCSQLISEKEEQRKMNEGQHEELSAMKEKCCQLRKSMEVMELEKQKLQDRCLCLEGEVLEKEEMLHLQREDYKREDAARAQSTEELKAVARHWTEKWQRVALTLQSTQEELEELKKSSSRNEVQVEAVHLTREIERLKKEGQKDKEEIEKLLQYKANMETVLTSAKNESDPLLKVELDTCKQELELERSKTQALLRTYKSKGVEASVQTQDKQTHLSQSSLSLESLSVSHGNHNKPHQVCLQSSEIEALKEKLAERDGKEEALKSLERLRETEINEAQLKISAQELKASENCRDVGGQTDVSTINSLRAQLEGSRRRANQLQQEKMLAVQRLQTLRLLYPVKDERSSVGGRKDTIVCPVNLETDQQRRMVTEQEREEKEVGNIDNRSPEAQTGDSSLQDWTPMCKDMKSAVNRRSWQWGSDLMPVFEEDEEDSDWPGGEEGKPAEEAHAEENVYNQNQQIPTMRAEINSLEAKDANLLQGTLRCKQPIQDCPPIAEEDESSEVPNLYDCVHDVDQQQMKALSFYPDGIFLAELVDICSPDENEEVGDDK